jgi:hypothetical protein
VVSCCNLIPVPVKTSDAILPNMASGMEIQANQPTTRLDVR